MGFFVPEGEPEGRLPTVREPAPTLTPTFTDVAGAAFRQQNTLVSVFRSLRNETSPADPDYRLNEDPDFLGSVYEQQFASRFLDSRSQADTRQTMRRIDEEDADRRTLDAAGIAGVVAQFGAG